jgi:hypothetical protein
MFQQTLKPKKNIIMWRSFMDFYFKYEKTSLISCVTTQFTQIKLLGHFKWRIWKPCILDMKIQVSFIIIQLKVVGTPQVKTLNNEMSILCNIDKSIINTHACMLNM